MFVGLGEVLFFQTSSCLVSGLTIDLSGQTFTSDCEKWQYSIKTVNSVSVRANQTATITRLGAPIFNFQCISRFFVTFQCESVIIILLSYQSSCSLIHTLLAAIIYCCFVNYSILHQVKRPEQSIAGHFECAHPGPCGGGPHGLYLLSVNSLGQNFQIIEFILLDVKQGL